MEKIKKLITKLYNINSNNINIDTLNFYETKYELTLLKLKNLKKEEPLRIFKKAHKKWEEEINILNNKLNECYDEIKNIF